MNRYRAIFKDVNDVQITVTITPTAGYSATTDLTLVGDSPVVITQESDGIFTPVKTKGCTISILTEEILWDLYSKGPFDWEVQVYRTGVGVLFRGYLTPCVYTQDYVYKGVIELEAVDCLAALENIEYSLVDNTNYQFVTVDTLLQTIAKKVPAWAAITTPVTYSYLPWDFKNYYLQEANFFDDDDEAMTCKEILEELGNYLGVTFTMNGNYLTCFNYPKISAAATVLDKDLYADGSPSIDIDEVYNKISIGCSLAEVEDLVDPPMDNAKTLINGIKYFTNGSRLYSTDKWSYRESKHHTKNQNRYRYWYKMYDFTFKDLVEASEANAKAYTASKWESTWYNIQTSTELPHSVSNLLSKVTADHAVYTSDSTSTNKVPVYEPYYGGCYPMRQYQYTIESGVNSLEDIAWTDYLMFIMRDHKNGSVLNSHLPCMKFSNNKCMPYSIASGTGYIIFKGSVWIQQGSSMEDCENDNTMWTTRKDSTLSTKDDYYNFIPCLSNVGSPHDWKWDTFYTRSSSSSEYNTGFNLFKAKLQIGDKYYNGTSWTTTESTFNLRFHEAKVSSDDEALTGMKWNPIAANPNDSTNYTEDAFAIPIATSDSISGALTLTLYTPYNLGEGHDYCNIYLKDFEVEYVFTNPNQAIDDITEEDDIVYENIIDTSYAIDMAELDLKINSWYQGKPMSTSYMCDTSYMPVVNVNGQPQEQNLIDMYYNHYSTPKKKFTVNYHVNSVPPTKRYKHSTLGGSGTTMVVDSYEMDVKAGTAELNLIEV